MKRTLTDTEIQAIKDRLDSLNLSYLETYHELMDHYVTALEQVEREEFDRKKESLDEEFAWSVVRVDADCNPYSLHDFAIRSLENQI